MLTWTKQDSFLAVGFSSLSIGIALLWDWQIGLAWFCILWGAAFVLTAINKQVKEDK